MSKKSIISIVLILGMLLFGSVNVFAELGDATALKLSLVNQDPDPAIAGDIVEVRIGVTNIGGGAAQNLMVELSPEYPLELVPGEDAVQSVGTIKGYQDDENMKILKYRLRVNRDATAGSYELKAKYYEEGSKAITTTSLSLDVESSDSAEIVYIDKTSLIPGEENNLKFTINNVGNAPLRDLSFSWQNNEKVILPVGSDNTKYVKYIDIGDSAELNYRVIADSNAEPGLYELSLSLQYDDSSSGETTEISTIAGVYVGGETDFRVAFSESTAEETSFSIANTGSNPAYSIAVTLPKQEDWTIKGSNSVIIGNLENGDYTIAGFVLQPNTNKDGIPLKVQIEYTDTSGKSHIIDKEVLLDSSSITVADTSGTGDKSNPLRTFGIVLVVLIVGFIVYRHYKKKRASKK